QQAGRKLQSGQPEPSAGTFGLLFPLKSSGNHQVNDDKEVTFKTEDDLFAQPPQLEDAAAFYLRNRRNNRAQDERAEQMNAFEHLAGNAGVQGLDIGDDVRQFRHTISVTIQLVSRVAA